MTHEPTHIRLFNIQRYSVHDGDGIRTSVFFKGCPLACKWCSNPESQRFGVERVYNALACINCSCCTAACPTGALPRENRKNEACIQCFRCEEACPTASIRRVGEDWDIEAVLDEILKDQAFYRVSGGGVTLTGGEPLAQPDACAALARAIKQLGIHLAIETSGYAPWPAAERVLGHCDQILYDIKEMDPQKHKRFTGVDNTLILDNARQASALKSDFIVRIPVIGGYNDQRSTVESIATFSAEIGAAEIHLLPFHPFGENKYDKTGIPYECNAYTPSDREMQALAEVARSCGVPVNIGG